MGAAIRRIVDGDDDLPWQQVLYAEVPLVNLSVADGRGIQIAAIGISPLRQFSVGGSLRRSEPGGEGITQSRELMLVIVLGGEDGGFSRKRRARVLEVGGNIHAVENAGAAANDGVRSQLVGKAQPRRKVIAIHFAVSVIAIGKNRGADHVADLSEVKVGVVWV